MEHEQREKTEHECIYFSHGLIQMKQVLAVDVGLFVTRSEKGGAASTT